MISLLSEQPLCEKVPLTLADVFWIMGDYVGDRLVSRDAAAKMGMSMPAFQHFVAGLTAGSCFVGTASQTDKLLKRDQRILFRALDEATRQELVRIHSTEPSISIDEAHSGPGAVERNILAGLDLVTVESGHRCWTYRSNLAVATCFGDS